MIEESALRRLGLMMYPQIFPPDRPDAEARRRSRQVFAAWYAWIGEGEALLLRLHGADESRPLPDYAEKLGESVSFARMRVKMSLDDMLDVYAQIARGEGVPLEEVRRELNANLQARRAAQVEAA